MRNLRATDVTRVANIMLSAEGVVRELGDILYESQEVKAEKSDKEKTLDGIEIARIILASCLKHCDREILEWMADVAEMDFDKFNDLGMKGIKDVIKHLSQQEGISGFFGDAFSLYQGKISSDGGTTES